MTIKATNEAITRKYRALYAVTRGEYYEIEAANEAEAEDLGFTDGVYVDSGETTDVTTCDIGAIEAFTSPTAYACAREAAGDVLEALQAIIEKAADLLEEHGWYHEVANAKDAIAKATPANTERNGEA